MTASTPLYPRPSCWWSKNNTGERCARIFKLDKAGDCVLELAGEDTGVDDLAKAIAECGTVENAIKKMRHREYH